MSLPKMMNKLFDYIMTPMTAVPEKFRAPIRNELRPDREMFSAGRSVMELIYANKEQLPPVVLSVIADLADELQKASPLGSDPESTRAGRISDAIRKMPGVTQRPTTTTGDPEPQEDKIIA